jgi:hypothetical protein
MTNATTPPRSRVRGGANLVSMFVHGGKTIKLVGAVLADPRVHWAQKFAFVGSIGALLLALFFPELIVDAIGGAATAGLFEFIGIPADVVIDWSVFAVAAFNLLKLFPAEIVGEHYDRLFRNR